MTETGRQPRMIVERIGSLLCIALCVAALVAGCGSSAPSDIPDDVRGECTIFGTGSNRECGCGIASVRNGVSRCPPEFQSAGDVRCEVVENSCSCGMYS